MESVQLKEIASTEDADCPADGVSLDGYMPHLSRNLDKFCVGSIMELAEGLLRYSLVEDVPRAEDVVPVRSI